MIYEIFYILNCGFEIGFEGGTFKTRKLSGWGLDFFCIKNIFSSNVQPPTLPYIMTSPLHRLKEIL